MIKFFLFIKKIHFVLAFVVLEAFALHYYANSTSYTKAKLITASNYVVGGIYSQLSGIGSYFRLKRENAALNAELAELRNRLDGLLPSTARDSVLSPADSAALTDTAGRRKYEYYPAKVVNNSIRGRKTTSRSTGAPTTACGPTWRSSPKVGSQDIS